MIKRLTFLALLSTITIASAQQTAPIRKTVETSKRSIRLDVPMTTVTINQAGQMPSPVVLKVEFETTGPALKKVANANMIDATTTEVTWPVSVWLNGSRTFNAVMDFGERKIKKITFDPHGRFPDADTTDNVWTREK